ncbi:hypothetical protein FNV43_RR20142 [Rhamnella rubrinervis]|uniref:Uncharacterized protein n=1 Tax=Rhamnella rubrinervis TaxID=2594499 RepID=A0A8K0E0K1_9ROSA|nr:hypothetical protein FNV43_RR20142 [Rhamnella rubrinervis]
MKLGKGKTQKDKRNNISQDCMLGNGKAMATCAGGFGLALLQSGDLTRLGTLEMHVPQGTPESVYLWQRVNSQLSSPSQPYSLREALSLAQSSRAGASAQALRESLHPMWRQKLAARILVVLLCKHDFDARCQKPDDKLYIVLLHFPLIGQYMLAKVKFLATQEGYLFSSYIAIEC